MKVRVTKMLNMSLVFLLASGLLVLLMAGCSNEESTGNAGTDSQGNNEQVTPVVPPNQVEQVTKPEVTDQPIKLSVYYPEGDGTYETFMKGIGDFIVNKYPNFSFEWMNTKNVKLNELAATGTEVDLMYGSSRQIAELIDAGFPMDLTDIIKKHNLDLNRIEPGALDVIRNVSGGALTALPYYMNHQILFYNRDIFDKFGEDYPRNHMNWDEIYSLTRNLTRKDGDVQYLGLSVQYLNSAFSWLNPYGQEIIDPGTKEVTFENGVWAKIYDTFLRFYDIPGNEYLTSAQSSAAFVEEQRLAMIITLSNRASGNPNSVPENWDMVSLPQFNDLPGVGAQVDPFSLAISTTSKHKDEAFAAITAMLSDEVQVELALLARLPVVDVPDIEKILSEQSPAMEGRNVSALFANKFAPATTLTQDVIAVRAHLGPAVNAIMRGEQDINSALREAAEKAKQTLQERALAN